MNSFTFGCLALAVVVLAILSLALWMSARRTRKELDGLARQIDTDARIDAATMVTLADMREMARAHFLRRSQS